MPPKKSVAGDATSFTDDLVQALKDDSVALAIGAIFEKKLSELLATIEKLKLENVDLKKDNVDLKQSNNDLKQQLISTQSKLNGLEAHDRKSNLIISGLPISSYAESIVSTQHEDDEPVTIEATENAVLELCNVKLGVKLSSNDISIAHRLKRSTNSKGPASVIVRFTTFKARDAVYRARKALKGVSPPMYINEDLTKPTAELFRRSRALRKNNEIFATWTMGGALYVRKTDHPSCKPMKINTEADLLNI